jgi:hypothetical protein
MNRRRLAAILRRRAELQRELAELEDEMADAMSEEGEAAAAPRRRGGSTRAPVVAPERTVSAADKAVALRRLRGAGARP